MQKSGPTDKLRVLCKYMLHDASVCKSTDARPVLTWSATPINPQTANVRITAVSMVLGTWSTISEVTVQFKCFDGVLQKRQLYEASKVKKIGHHFYATANVKNRSARWCSEFSCRQTVHAFFDKLLIQTKELLAPVAELFIQAYKMLSVYVLYGC